MRSAHLLVPALLMLCGVQPLAQESPAFIARTELVVLHVNVQDRNGGWVSGLPSSAFLVLEDNQPQVITHFVADDSPVTVGLLIDNSISMRESRDRVIAGARAFAEAGHPDDEVFALAFNEDVLPVLPLSTPFAESPALLQQALTEVISARGRTALFDAIVAGFTYAERGRHARKVLVVISDGGDNASRQSFETVIRDARSGNVVIYGVALVDPLDSTARPDRLAELAGLTGGASYRPRDASQVSTVLRRVAEDIRRTYTVGYAPTRAPDGSYRAVRVVVTPPDKRRVSVRTRSGYVANKASSHAGTSE
jgi:Ca-activated chloride channel family protein